MLLSVNLFNQVLSGMEAYIYKTLLNRLTSDECNLYKRDR